MSWTPREQEVAAVLALPGPKRYSYWVKKVADEERVWSLAEGDGWLLVGDADGQQAVPVWPHQAFAAACAERWPGAEPREIALGDWLDRWIPGMIRDGRAVAVFPNRDGQGPVVPPERVAEDLDEELAQYE